MADTESKNISLALYRYMCQNIVGSENNVKTLRLMHTVSDNMKSNEKSTMITSGSFGEGLNMRGSDLDIMKVIKKLEVYEDIKTAYNSHIIYFSMETDDVKAGFTHLLVEQMISRFLSKLYKEHNGQQYLSSSLFLKELLRRADRAHGHGPCISDDEGKFDYAICLHCKTWISQASQWIKRSSNSWPSSNVKQSIIKHGVLFVPIGVKGSPKEDIEWRISFSVGEKFLINTFTHTQLICYALLKILLKDVIATFTECEDLLCSYFLKTITFWISEELPQSIWKPENLIHCFIRCFSRLIYSVDYSVCLHYFIPENNMFENKIEGRARAILLEKLYNLLSYGWRCILFSDQFINFHVSMNNINIESHILHTSEVGKTLKSESFLLSLASIDNLDSKWNAYRRGMHQIVSCDKSSNKYICVYYMSLTCASIVRSISFNSTKSSNKHQYNHQKSCLCTLLQNIHHDAVSGWLMLASLLYKSKQYSNALHIAVYAISKLTPEKLHSFTDIHCRLLNLQSFERKCIVQLWKIMHGDYMKFKRNSWLIPYELQMEVSNGLYIISSRVYGYFLIFLCHYHLKNVKQCLDSFHTLQFVIKEHLLFEKNKDVRSGAFNIFGNAIKSLGDSESTRHAFVQSFEIDPDN